jgi:hypothetical protein
VLGIDADILGHVSTEVNSCRLGKIVFERVASVQTHAHAEAADLWELAAITNFVVPRIVKLDAVETVII